MTDTVKSDTPITDAAEIKIIEGGNKMYVVSSDKMRILERELNAAVSWNHAVSVCSKHTADIIDDECAICEIADLKAKLAACEEPTETMMIAGDEAILDGLRKASLGISYGLHPDHASWSIYKAMRAALKENKHDA